MKYFTLNLAVTLVVAFAVAAGRQPREHVLDLTSPSIVRSSPTSIGSSPPTSSPDARVLPLQLRLRTLDRGEYRFGEEATYEVALTNTSRADVVLPWSVDFEALSAAGAPPVRAGLALSLDSEAAVDTRVALVALGGAPSVAGSLLRLAPGERAVIRTRTNTGVPQRVGERFATGEPIKVRAVLTLQTADPVLWQPLFSENAVPVRFRVWQQPRVQ